MKIPINGFLHIVLFAFLFTGCNNAKQSNAEAKENQSQSNKEVVAGNNIEIEAPDFADPAIKQYYSSYTAYLKKVVTTIRNKDEAQQ